MIFNETEVKHGQPLVREEMALPEYSIALQALRLGAKNLSMEITAAAMDTRTASKGIAANLQGELTIVTAGITQLEILETQERLAGEAQEFLGKRSN